MVYFRSGRGLVAQALGWSPERADWQSSDIPCNETFRGGTHDLWIRYWLAAGGANPDTDCETIVIPPPQMVANMRAGTQDAFCVGEPWNAQLVSQKLGATAATTSELWMNHPEKALGMRADWVARYPRAAQALVSAVMEAQRWCDDMKNRSAMCSIVAGRQYINVPLNDILPPFLRLNVLNVRHLLADHRNRMFLLQQASDLNHLIS